LKIYNIIKPILFLLPPEKAQVVADFLLKQTILPNIIKSSTKFESELLNTNFAGINFPNPIGLAAGWDKNCTLLSHLESFGFGYITGGTITKNPRPGNNSPRMVRLKKDNALINSLGFPGYGLDKVLKILSNTPAPKNNVKRILSISGETIYDINECHKSLERFASAIEINISSPNTEGLRIFQTKEKLKELILEINKGRKKPLFIKIPPYEALNKDSNHKNILDLIKICIDQNVEAITVANTRPVKNRNLAVGKGGLSGAPLLKNTIAMVQEISKMYGHHININACGGVSNGEEEFQLLESGASSVQIYTSIIYQGPGVVKKIKRELVRKIVDSS
jgi:dihydroorotate dehydrogenase